MWIMLLIEGIDRDSDLVYFIIKKCEVNIHTLWLNFIQ